MRPLPRRLWALVALGATVCGCPALPSGPTGSGSGGDTPARRRSAATPTPAQAALATLAPAATSPRPARQPASATPRATPTPAIAPTPRRSPSITTVPLAGVQVSTFAGTTVGAELGPLSGTRFITPQSLARDADGNLVVSDFLRILKIDRAGQVTAFMTRVQPHDFVFDAAGDLIVAERYHVLARYDRAGRRSVIAGRDRGFADGQGESAQFNALRGIAIDQAGNLYLADGNNCRIRKVTPAGYVTTLAGGDCGFRDGNGSQAAFKEPMDVALDAEGNVFVADYGNGRIRKITPRGYVSTYARLNAPDQLEIDRTGQMYVTAALKIYAVPDPADIVLLAGLDQRGTADGPSSTATLLQPGHLFVDDDGTIYFPDISSNVDGSPSLIRTLTLDASAKGRLVRPPAPPN